MLWNALEALGLLCLVAFAWCVWPPLALLVLGVALVAVGYLGEGGLFATAPAADTEEVSS